MQRHRWPISHRLSRCLPPGCLPAIGLASQASTFVWMAPGFLLTGGVLMWLWLRRRAR